MKYKAYYLSAILKYILVIFTVSGAGAIVYADQIDDVRNSLKEWVSVEKTISLEQETWREEKQLLNDISASLDQEERILRETITNAEQDVSRVDEERLELISRRDSYERSSGLFQQRLVLYERQAEQLIPRLPKILQDEVAQLINRLSLAERGNYSLSERAQTLVNLLTAIQQFDGSITVANEIRTLSNGEELEVKVLFLGLSKAFYADSGKRTAGIGRPIDGGTDGGWQWIEQNDLADDIINAVEIYENNQSPSLVGLPLEIETN